MDVEALYAQLPTSINPIYLYQSIIHVNPCPEHNPVFTGSESSHEVVA
jgi:hypothetical protein